MYISHIIGKYAVINIEACEVFVRSVYSSVALFITRGLYTMLIGIKNC